MTHDELKDDLSLFVLGALNADEAQAIERHLAEGCDECRAEMGRWREVVDLMPFAADVEAPRDLRDELMRRIGSGDAAPAEATPAAAAPSAKVVPLRRRWPLVFAAAAGLALAFGISRQIQLDAQLREQAALVSQLQVALERTMTNLSQGEAELKKVRDALTQRDSDAAALRTALTAAESSLALLQKPGLSLVHLKQTPDAQPAEGHVLISPSGKALFYAFDLTPLPAGKVYELWWITEGEGPVNAGLFQPDASGLGQVETMVPTTAGAIKAAAVTIEPEGGVQKPTGPMVLLGSI